MLLLGEKVASQDPGFAFWLDRRLKWSVVSAVAIYAVSLAAFGLGSDNIVSARNFGLFALFGVAQQLGAWRYGSKVGLWIALAIAAMIAASESRLALGIAVALFPLAQIPTRRWTGLIKMAAVMAGVAVLSYALFINFEALQQRFLTGDVSLRVGSIGINGSGRSAFWKLTVDSIQDNLAIGQGAGSAEGLIESVYAEIRHPHNDYLRVLHDYGVVGLTMWAVGLLAIVAALWSHWRKLDPWPRHGRIQLTALLMLLAFWMEMTAENAIVYVYVTAPLGLIVGAALGVQRAVDHAIRVPPALNSSATEPESAPCPC
jgi:O-antigen ligase